MARTALRRRLSWQVATVVSLTRETPSVVTIELDPPDWPGHRAGQHLDLRLTAEDGYAAERSYSIASAPGEPLAITVEWLEGGEVSPYLTEELRAGDKLELRGPTGGYFVWEHGDGSPLMLLAGGSGVVPLRSILRHRKRTGSDVPARLLYSSRRLPDVIYRGELDQYYDGSGSRGSRRHQVGRGPDQRRARVPARRRSPGHRGLPGCPPRPATADSRRRLGGPAPVRRSGQRHPGC